MRRLTPALGSALVLTLALAGCTGGSDDTAPDSSDEVGFVEEGLPIVSKTVTLRFSGEKAPLAPDYDSMSLVKQWEKDTNVDVVWENLPENVYEEKKSLLLASGDLPDAFYNTGFTDQDIATYGANGTLIPLEDLIEKHAPNLQKVFEERPEIKAAVTASDGHIYTLPAAEELGIGAVPFFWSINKKWLDALGLPVPRTTEEYRAALEAFKTKDPNGNGEADEIPLSFINNWWCADVGDLFAALGGMPDNPDHRIVRDDKVIYTAAQPEYKNAVAELHEWYAAGLLDPEAFTQDDKAYLAKGKTETPTLGSFVWWETEEVVGAERAADYVLMPPLKGVAGQLVGRSNGGDYTRDAFAITRANKYPAVTMRWVDRLYEPVMSAQVSWGPIGETLEKGPDGVLVHADPPAGASAGELRQKVSPDGPHVLLKEHFETVVRPEPRALQRLEDLTTIYLPHAEEQNYPTVFFSLEELQELSTIEADVKALVDEKRARWIVDGGVAAEWDAYVAQLESIGLDRMVEIYQQAYDRYQENA